MEKSSSLNEEVRVSTDLVTFVNMLKHQRCASKSKEEPVLTIKEQAQKIEDAELNPI